MLLSGVMRALCGGAETLLPLIVRAIKGCRVSRHPYKDALERGNLNDGAPKQGVIK